MALLVLSPGECKGNNEKSVHFICNVGCSAQTGAKTKLKIH